MTANDSKSYLAYLNKLVDQYNNTYHHSISKNLLILIILLWLKKLWRILKLLNLKLMIELQLLCTRLFLVKITLKIGQKKYLFDSVFKTSPWTNKIKDLNDVKIIGIFHGKELLLSKL